MFRDNGQLHWQRIAEGNYSDIEDAIKYRAYQRSDGLELRVLLMNNQYKLICKNASESLITACSSLPLFSEDTVENNAIGMSCYSPNPDIILQYLQTIDSTTAFAAARAEILCFFGLSKTHPAQRAKELEHARIYYLENVEKENDELRGRVAELEAYLEIYHELAQHQAEHIFHLEQQLHDPALDDDQASRANLTRSY